jgi:hypothetical protein
VTAEGRNREVAVDSHCEMVGRISMVMHVHTCDVFCWSIPRLYSNSTVRVSLDMAVNNVRVTHCFLFGPLRVI